MHKVGVLCRVWAGLRSIALLIAPMVCSVAAAGAQESVAAPSADTSSVRARPYSERRAFLVTNAGAYVQLGDGLDGGRWSAIVDAGAMVNLSPKNAVGGSWFVMGDDGFVTGPVLRWRRWLGPTQSLDVAVGTPITGHQRVRPGSLLGLVKYNPVHWFGIAARPELVRHSDYYDQSSYRRVPNGSKMRLSLGAELGGKPGRVLGVVAIGVLGVGILAIAASGGIL